MNRPLRGPGGRKLKKDAQAYGIVCLFVFVLVFLPGIPGAQGAVPGAAKWALFCLFIGGTGVFFLLSRFAPAIEESEFFRAFEILYHPGLLVLCASLFLGGIYGEGSAAGFFNAVRIAGWTLLAASAVVLVLMITEHKRR